MFKITNLNDFDFTGRFDGVDFHFPAPVVEGGVTNTRPVYCEDGAANHIFGLGRPDKTEVLARNGWAPIVGGLAKGMAVLNKFQFEYVTQELDAPMASVGYVPTVADEAHEEHDPALVLEGAEASRVGALASAADQPVKRGPGRPRLNP